MLTKIFFACNDPVGLEKQMNDWFKKVGNIVIDCEKVVASGRMDHNVTVYIRYHKI